MIIPNITAVAAALTSTAATLTNTVLGSGTTTSSSGSTSGNTAGFTGATVGTSRGGKATCVSGTISVSVSASNIKFNFDVPQNQTAASQVFLSVISAGSTVAQQIVAGTTTVSGTYSIGASLCYPSGATINTVHVLTHGIGYDRYYWDFAPGYSYVDAAAAAGHATLLYDRLGQGQSSKPDPVSVLQAPMQVEIAKALATMVRNGALGGIKPKNVVGVGHSFGSIITEAINANSPAVFDAAILTGFSTDQSGVPPFLTSLNLAIASANNPARFGSLPAGYLAVNSVIGNQIGYFRFPGFDPAILAAADAQKGTAAYGEFFTLGAVGGVASNYNGPVAIVNGAQDLPFCYGNCAYPADKSAAALAALYPAAKSGSTTYTAPNAGHGLNLHYSAAGAWTFVMNFLKNNGL